MPSKIQSHKPVACHASKSTPLCVQWKDGKHADGKKSEVPEPDRPDPKERERDLGNDEPTAGAHDRGPERTSRATGRQECSQLSTVISPSRGSQQKLNLNMHMQKETEIWYGGTWKSVLCMWHSEVQITAQDETATAYTRDERYLLW